MNKLDTLLYEIYANENNFNVSQCALLTEDVKENTIKELASSVLNNIKEKMSDIDTTNINKSRGEIKNYINLGIVQKGLTSLTALVQSSMESVNPLLPKYLKEIVTTLYNLNKYSVQFKNAYRDKKTIMMLKYQSIILSIIASLSYLISVSIDVKDANTIKLKKNIEIEEILPIHSLMEFNKSVENGLLDSELHESTVLRNFFIEYSVSELSTIYEAVDIISLLNNGIAAFNNNFIHNPGRNGLLLKVLGIVIAILSLRETLYAIYNSKNKISDYINNIKTFLNLNSIPSLSGLSKFVSFNNKSATDAENATKITKAEISSENNQIINTVKNSPTELGGFEDAINSTASYVPSETAETVTKEDKPAEAFDFNF